MSIITISRGTFSHGQNIAGKIADKLGYQCISREILIEASKQFDIPEFKLLQAIKDTPSFFDRLSHSRDVYVTYIQIALLRHLLNDNIVYHGFAGHFFVKNIRHVLKVRIIARFDDRVGIVMERNALDRAEAIKTVKRIDNDRKKWSKHLYGIDTNDSNLYDLVINICNLSVDDAVEIICHTVSLDRFRSTAESQTELVDLLLAAEVKSALSDLMVDFDIKAEAGVIYLTSHPRSSIETEMLATIRERVVSIRGVKGLNFVTHPSFSHTNPFHNI